MISELIMAKLTRKKHIFVTDSTNLELILMREKAYSQGEIINWFIERVVYLKLLRAKDAAEEVILVPKVIRKLVNLRKIVAYSPSFGKRKEERYDDFVLRKENLTILIAAKN
jgi:hypothetical protein